MTRILILSILFFALANCVSARGDSHRSDTALYFYHKTFKVEVLVKYPAIKSKGTILLLHGYNLPHTQWCEKTSFCTEALKSGYTIVIPNFGKSTYQEKFYRQTTASFRQYPTRKWMRDTVLTALQKQLGLLKEGQNNFVLGLSTGARGAALLALDLPNVFKGAGCLSGDYDQVKLPFEKIYHNYYGNFKEYKSVWQTDDNLHYMIDRWKTPVYLAHGQLDNICPVSQTINFYKLLSQKKPSVKCKYVIVKDQKHDYTFWGSQTKGVLTFFNELVKP